MVSITPSPLMRNDSAPAVWVSKLVVLGRNVRTIFHLYHMTQAKLHLCDESTKIMLLPLHSRLYANKSGN